MTSPSKHRAEVTFDTRQEPGGRPVISLVLTRDGRPTSGETQFTFELVPDFNPEELELLVQVLNRCVTHLAMAAPDREPEGKEPEGEEPEGGEPRVG